MAKKSENTEQQEDNSGASKLLLKAILNGKETKHTHFNDYDEKPVIISSGSLKLDNYIKIKSGGIVRIGGPAESGKAQPIWSKVLTPNGWVEIGSLKQGHLIIGSDGKAHQVLKVFPQGKLKINKMIFADKTFVYCCDEHLWYTREYQDRLNGKKGCVKTTNQIKKTIIAQKRHHNHSIPYVKAIEFKKDKEELPIDPYLLGLLIGDGCFSFGVGKYRIGYSSADEELLEQIRSRLPSDVCLRKAGKNKYNFDIYGQKIKKILADLGLDGHLSYQKFIPKQFLFASIEQRKEILQGLMDTDGTVSRDSCSTTEFSTTSPQLAEDVTFLARSLGGRATIRSRYTFYPSHGEKKMGKKSFRVVLSFSDFCPFKLKRKAEKFTKREIETEKLLIAVKDAGEEECVCIKIDSEDSLYVTDGFNLTHNTSESILLLENYIKAFPKAKGIYVNAEAKFHDEIQKRTGLKYVRNAEEWEYGTVFVLDSNCFDTVCDILTSQFKQIKEDGGHLGVIIDSVDTLRLKSSFEASVSDSKKPAGVNYLTKELFRHLSHPISAYNGMLIMITQYSATFTMDKYEKEAPNLMGGNQTHALNHQASYALYYRPRAASHYIKENDPKGVPDPVKNPILGVYAHIEIRKSATDNTGYCIEVPIKKGRIGNAIWVEKEIFDALLSLSLLEMKGAWITISDIVVQWAKEAGFELKQKHQGMDQFSNYFETNPKLTTWLINEKIKIFLQEGKSF